MLNLGASKGTSISQLDIEGGGRLEKCPYYYINLIYSKYFHKGGEDSNNSQKLSTWFMDVPKCKKENALRPIPQGTSYICLIISTIDRSNDVGHNINGNVRNLGQNLYQGDHKIH